jgi:hypothetical protein
VVPTIAASSALGFKAFINADSFFGAVVVMGRLSTQFFN